MPGGGKKAVFPPLHLHEHDGRGACSEHQERQKKLLQARGKSMDQKESPDKDKSDKTRNQAGSSKSDQKTPTKDKDLIKQEQQRLKNEQKAQQKLEKEQLKHDKELQKEHQKELQKLEKEHQKQEKEQQKQEKELQKQGKEQQKQEKEQQKQDKELQKQEQTKYDQKSTSKNCFKGNLQPEKPGPVLKTQKSFDVASIKHQKSFESQRPMARNSVDMQYTKNLFEGSEAGEASMFSSSTSLAKTKSKK